MYTGKGALYPFEYNLEIGSLNIMGGPGPDYFSYKKHDIKELFAMITVSEAEVNGWLFDKAYWPAEYQNTEYIYMADRTFINLGDGNDQVLLTKKAKHKLKNLDGVTKDNLVYIWDEKGKDTVTVSSKFNTTVFLNGESGKYGGLKDKVILKGKGWKLVSAENMGNDEKWLPLLKFQGIGKTSLWATDSHDFFKTARRPIHSINYTIKVRSNSSNCYNMKDSERQKCSGNQYFCRLWLSELELRH